MVWFQFTVENFTLKHCNLIVGIMVVFRIFETLLLLMKVLRYVFLLIHVLKRSDARVVGILILIV